MSGSICVGSSDARLAAAGLTAITIRLLTAGLSMLQPLSTDLYLSTLRGIGLASAAIAFTLVRKDNDISADG